MSNPEQLDQELREYLEKEPNLRRDERINYLRIIVKKHLEFNTLMHVINYYDIFNIINTSKVNYANFKLPLKISKKQIDNSDVTHVAMIESVIGYLNKMNLLKKPVKFDHEE